MWALLSKWKWDIVAILFLVYSVGVWHVSGTYATATLVKAELERTQENNTLAKTIVKKLDDTQADYDKKARQATKDIVNELLKDPIYKSCRVTDGVRNAIQRKLDAQPE